MDKFRSDGTDAVDRVFAALADPTRRAIIARLSNGEATLSELAVPHDMTLPAVMKHVSVLANAGIVVRRKNGRVVTCALSAVRLEDARAWLDRHLAFWTVRLDALETLLEEPAASRRQSTKAAVPARSRTKPKQRKASRQ